MGRAGGATRARSHAWGKTSSSQGCYCAAEGAPPLIFNFLRRADGAVSGVPATLRERGAGAAAASTSLHSVPRRPAAQPLGRDAGWGRRSREHRGCHTVPGRARGEGRGPRSRCAVGPRFPRPLPAPPALSGTVPQRQRQTPPSAPRVARLGAPSPLSARRSLPAAGTGGRRGACGRDAEGLRASSDATAGSSPGEQPPRLLKTETLRLRRSLSSLFLSPFSMR